jgi:anti-sigma factor RsiW
MKRFSNRCQPWRESICLLAGNALSSAEQAEVQRHLAACPECLRYYQEIKSVTAPLANWEKNFSGVQPDQTLQTRWRKAVLAATDHRPAPRFSFRTALRMSWRELIRPSRHAWAAMAALWIVMAGINATQSGAQRNVSSARSSTTSTTLQVFEEQRRVLAELIPPIVSQPIEPPRREYPHPRSQRKTRWSMG